jgi:excisionase family DNA binding protein
MEPTTKLLTAEDIAVKLNCHVMTVYRNREIPRLEIPGVGLRFNEADVDGWLRTRTTRKAQPIKRFMRRSLKEVKGSARQANENE